MQCPNCSAENQTGNYCASCGAALDIECASCGADVPAGASFCTSCGAPVGGGDEAGGGSPVAPGLIAAIAVAVVAILVVVYLPGQTRTAAPADGAARVPFMGSTGSEGASGSEPGAAAPGMDGLSSDMRTNADRLFNRIMSAAEAGNQAEVDQFMPMAIRAYGMVDDLDDDGLFHLGLLHLTAGTPEQAADAAGRILADNPDHLLGLAVAAQAAAAQGDSARAAEYWQRYLDAYDTESGRPLPEYVDHQPVLPDYQQMARDATGAA